jgi:hypothetical protein
MSKNRILKTGLVLAIASVSVHGHAATRQAGLEACAEAMVNGLAESQGAPMVLNLDPESTPGTRKLSSRDVFHLDAYDPDSDEVIARTDCVVDSRAKVIRLIEVPLDGPEARIRATTLN